MPFDAERAFAHVAALAEPRRTGSPGELRARAYAERTLRDLGYTVEVVPFRASHLPWAVAYRLAMGFGGAAFALAGWLGAPWAWLPYGLGVAFVLGALAWPWLIPWFFDRGPKWHSANVIARWGDSEAALRLVLMAHYDSKSTRWPIWLNVGLMELVGGAALGVGAVLALGGPEDVARTFGLCALGAVAVLVLGGAGNRSPGAVDNAAGLGVVLELARVIGQAPEFARGLFVEVVATGMEEEGLAGAIHYTRSGVGDPARLRVLNFDSVGVRGPIAVIDAISLPPLRTAKRFGHWIEALGRERRIPIVRRRLPPGTGVDTVPLGLRGVEAVSLISGRLGREMLSLHSRHDGLHHVDREALGHAGTLGVAVIGSLAAEARNSRSHECV